MNLSPMLDVAIAIGLVYLILSILAAELLGLLTTLLQWRAEHLKKSISIVLTGQSPSPPHSRFIIDRLYDHPLVRSLIHREKQSVAASVRKVGRSLRSVGCAITQSEDILSDQALPDDIPADFLAIALIDGLKLPHLSHTYSVVEMQTFVDERLAQMHLLLNDLRNSLGNDDIFSEDLDQLKQSLNDIIHQFMINRASFAESIGQIVEQLIDFLGLLESQLSDEHHCKTIIRHRLPYLKQATLLSQPEPTLSEVITLFTPDKRRDRQPHLSPEIIDILTEVLPTDSGSMPEDNASEEQPSLAQLPQPFNDALQTLTYFAQRRSDNLISGLQSLKNELAEWLRRSLSQAHRVDRRNRIGVSLLISFVIAIVANVDVFYLLNRFTNDPTLRTTIEQTAVQQTGSFDASQRGDRLLQENNVDPLEPPAISSPQILVDTLDTTREAVDDSLNDLPFPLGWQAANLDRQTALYPRWVPSFLGQCLGWAVSGLLIATGASLWYIIRF